MKKLLVIVLSLAFLLSITTGGVMAEGHEEVLAEIDTTLTTYFARVQDNPMVQVGNMAQIWYVEENLKDEIGEGDLPVISTNFVNGGGRDSAEDYSYIEDEITSREEFYQYPDNTLTVLKLNGKQIREAIEYFARNYNQIDPEEEGEQFLVKIEDVADYEHHHIEGIEYQYDITKPQGERLVYAKYEGEELDEDMEFLVAMNSYRATSDTPNFNEDNIVLSTDKNNVDVMIDYINERDGEIPELTHNWSLAPVETEGQILFRTSPKAVEYMKDAPEPVDHISHVGEYSGFAIMEYDLSVGSLK